MDEPGKRGACRIPIHDLGPAVEVEREPRLLFDPKRGLVRRVERELVKFLHTSVYPRVPRLSRVYERQLRRNLVVSRASVRNPGVPPGFEGARLLLLTDPHAGPFVSATALRRTFRDLLRLEPDLVLLGGDLVTGQTSELAECREAFRELGAGPPLGALAVLGNHDHYTSEPESVREEIRRAGIRVLDNESVVLERSGDRLTLAGIDDLLMGRPDLDAALDGAKPPVVLLSHNPDIVFDAAARGVALVLAGHTHGGQIRLRGAPVLVRQSRYHLDEGRFRVGPTELVVSRGLGAVGLPLRVSCPPEAVLLEIRGCEAIPGGRERGGAPVGQGGTTNLPSWVGEEERRGSGGMQRPAQ